MKKPVLLLFIVLSTGLLYAQIGGKRTFEFLNLPTNARTAGLGGVIISATDNDVNMFLSNPALLDSANDNFLSFNQRAFYADIKYNSFAYTKNFNKLGVIGFGIQNFNYGNFESYDAAGNSIGTFSAGETAITIYKSRTQGLFTLGVNLKYVQSIIGNYRASGFFMDLGGVFKHPEKELTLAINFKSLGFLTSDYTDTSNSQLPFDVQIGATFKPKFMPFRFTFTGYNLARNEGAYFDESISLAEDKPKRFDRIFRHINIGTELILGKNFNIRMGYNHLLRKELRLQESARGAGISFGFMLRIKAFELAYSNAKYHAAGGTNFITITSDLNRVIKRKRKV